MNWHSKLVFAFFTMAFWALNGGISAASEACEIVQIPCKDFAGFSESGINSEALVHLDKWRVSNPISANHRFITLFDVSQHSAVPRFVVIDTENKEINSYLAAHGKGSDPDHDGVATNFSDVPGSRATPLGFFQTAETYTGKHGLSLRLDGLETRNKNARARSIVIHGADYVDPARDRLGRSWGCPALSRSDLNTVIHQIKEGSLLYIHEGTRP